MGSIIMYCPFEFKEKALNGIKNIEGNVISRIYSNNEIKERLQTYTAPYRELMSYYRCAMMQSSMSSTRSCRFSMTATR